MSDRLFEPEDPFKPWQRSTPYEKGMEGSDLAARKWTDREVEQVDIAIERCAHELDTFTADDIWKRIPTIRVTKGLAGRLNRARNRGLIESTGEVTFADRGGDHDHRQRLAVWRSKVR